jgi:hypothetical protein
MKYILIVFSCFIIIGCTSKEGNNMFFGKKTEKILKNKNGQNALVDIDNLLSPVFYKNPKKLTLCEKNIVCIVELEHEVNNGGFRQYFFNSSGNFAKETLNALNIIGSKIFFNILEKAINKFPNGIVPSDRDKRQNILNKLEIDLWDELDNEFYKYEEDIYKLVIEYIKNNINEFR